MITLLDGLKILRDKNYLGVYVTSDSLLVVQTVTKPHEDFGYLGTIVAEIGELIKGPVVSNLSHIRQSANEVTHSLAKFSILSHTPLFWVSGEFPFWLDKLVSGDL